MKKWSSIVSLNIALCAVAAIAAIAAENLPGEPTRTDRKETAMQANCHGECPPEKNAESVERATPTNPGQTNESRVAALLGRDLKGVDRKKGSQ